MNEEAFYDLVATEIQQGQLKPGLWTKAFADANGDQTKARVLYIRQRVAQLEQEAIEAARLRREQEKQAAQQRADEEWERLYAKDKPTDIRAHVITVAAIILTVLLIWLVVASQ